MKAQRSIYARGVAIATLSSLIATSCGARSPKPATLAAASPLSDQVLVQTKDLPPGLDLTLTEGTQGPPSMDRSTLAPATKLSAADVQALLARTRPITADPADKQDFALRPGSKPAPRTGKVIKAAFPAPPSSLLPPAASDAGKPLEVLRYMPEGAVPLAPELSVTFSQPMIAVTSQTDAAASTPVRLTPQPKGQWRWIGTRTILFDPDVRFPQATTYTVEVPKGTKSASGAVLASATRFTFETPAPTLVQSYPPASMNQRLDVPMFALFDQKIDPAAVLASIKVTANNAPVDVRLVDAAELAKDKQLAAIVDATNKAEQAGRWLAFRATRDLPKDAQIQVEIGAGTPSAEGPNKTKAAQSFAFHTYPPLRIDHAECGWGNECRPGMPFQIVFNNQLDVDRFDEAQLAVTPEIAQQKIVQSGTVVSVSGLTSARTHYKVVVSGGLLDEFGQTLGKDTTLEFTVGDAYPTFFGPSGMVVLDPAAQKRTLDFFSTNYEHLKVQLYDVQPRDYDAFALYMRNQWNRDKPPRPPGKKVVDKLVTTSAAANKLVETSVDLQQALSAQGLGHALAIVEPSPWTESYPPPRMIAWVQATKLAVDAYVDAGQLTTFVTELATGKPAANVTVELRPQGVKATTDAKGLARLDLPAAGVKGASYLTATRGADVAFVTDESGYWSEGGSWVKQARPSQLAWYVIDDRKMYKPGEEVTLKGWLRVLDPGKNGDLDGLGGAVTSVTYKVNDSRGNKIASGTAAVNAVGGFDTKFTLPSIKSSAPNLGYAYIQLEAKGRMRGAYTHSFQIQEFRRPEFEVSAHASQGPFLVGNGGDVTVDAKYFAGGPLAGAPVNWYVTATQTTFTPPNRDDYVFGEWLPWWGWRDDGATGARATKTWEQTGKTDATGAHTVHFAFHSINPAVPMAVTANASVTDVNRQTWSSAAAMIVHPSTAYVGLKTTRPFVDKGAPFPIDVIGVGLDGKALPGAKIEVKASRVDWEVKKGTYKRVLVDPQTCELVAKADASHCEFATPAGGQYEVTAVIVDDKGRPNTTKLTFWVSGGDRPPAREVEQERVQIIPDKKDYRAGDVAELLVQAPFSPAEAVVSWRRSGIVKTERISLTGPTTKVHVPITEGMVPNLIVQVDMVGAAARTDDKGVPDPKLPARPAYAVGSIDLPVPPKQRTLHVTVAPSAAKVAPGETARIAVTVKDAAGRPVPSSETALIVVDEAVLSLTGYVFPNPIDVFYGARSADARDFYSRAYVKLAKPDANTLAANQQAPRSVTAAGMGRAEAAPAPAMPPAPPPRDAAKKEAEVSDESSYKAAGNTGGGGATTAIAIRSNFNPLAAFSPTVKTDANGRATLEVKVPDNLTRYRIVAISTAGERQFGKGESALTARLPLMVRPSPPRFLNFGDTFKLPVVIQNQTDAPMTVKLAVRATNAAITDGAGRQVSVPANERVEVQFPAAAELAGTARFQIVGASGRVSDAAEVALPVWTPATTEAFATYGVIDSGVVRQPVALPGKVVKQFGGLEVTTSSTNLQALTDAFLYLVKYPFECAEQRASRIMSIAALRDVLTAFKTKDLPTPAALEASVKVDVERLSQMQNYDGGYAFWERGYPSNPYLTVYVTNALVHAQKKGFAVPAVMLQRAKPYLKSIEQHYPWYYSKEVRWAISAYALATRKLMGDTDIAKGKKLFVEYGGTKGTATMETHAWLLSLFAQDKTAAAERKEIVRHALNRASETAGAANFVTSYGDGAYLLLASDRRVDAVMLDALIAEQPSLDLIPKVVTGLLAHRKAGRWLNTQENTFALLALDSYFQTYEKVTPNFVARVWLGDDYAGDHAFKGRSTDYYSVAIPMKDVATHDKQDLTIQKDGKGRLYYRVGMTYAPASLELAPADYGFVVTRIYEGADDAADVTRDAQGTWHMKAGARVRVKLTMVNENRRYHVALVDPMPAGLEAMNPALATTGPIPTDPNEQKARGAYWWWYGPWYEHQNLRDERTEAFASLLWQGVHEYSYVARATTPGNFVVPPPKAEEMYMPETFGRGGSDRVIVE